MFWVNTSYAVKKAAMLKGENDMANEKVRADSAKNKAQDKSETNSKATDKAEDRADQKAKARREDPQSF